MKIDTTNLRVVKLLGAWRDLPHLSEEVLSKESRAFQKAFVREIIEPSTAEHSGELILFYHKFLTRIPNGMHGFARGSGMMSKDVYWVTVARIKSDMFLSLVETQEKVRTLGSSQLPIRVPIPSKFLIPVEWKIHLKPRYKDSHSPYFVVTDSVNEKRAATLTDTESKLLDISAFGQHLFRFGRNFRDDLSWATNIFLVIGDTSVKAWLTEVGSPPDVFEKLEHWQADNADTQAPPQE